MHWCCCSRSCCTFSGCTFSCCTSSCCTSSCCTSTPISTSPTSIWASNLFVCLVPYPVLNSVNAILVQCPKPKWDNENEKPREKIKGLSKQKCNEIEDVGLKKNGDEPHERFWPLNVIQENEEVKARILRSQCNWKGMNPSPRECQCNYKDSVYPNNIKHDVQIERCNKMKKIKAARDANDSCLLLMRQSLGRSSASLCRYDTSTLVRV